jgi:aldehyde:ferredoxin oxidoreductase
MYGWHQKLLRVNLTDQKFSIENIDPKISRDYIGGRGVAMRYLYN